MRYFHKLQNQFWKPVINLDKVSRATYILGSFAMGDRRICMGYMIGS